MNRLSNQPPNTSLSMSRRITVEDFCQIWGIEPDLLNPTVQKQLAETNLQYSIPSKSYRDSHIRTVLERVDGFLKKRSTAENTVAFHEGWAENLALCHESGVSNENLKPKYLRPYSLVRGQGDYICPDDPRLLDNLYAMFVVQSAWLYFNQVQAIYEFGCGTGQYLYRISELFPQTKMVGLDWVESSQDIMDLIHVEKPNISGRKFDMFHPDTDYQMEKESAILTVGALEQLGERHEAFLEYILSQSPKIVVHHEPVEEFYDDAILYDYLAHRFHQKRGYLANYLTKLRELEQEGRIHILHRARVPYGDPFHESGSLIAWAPA